MRRPEIEPGLPDSESKIIPNELTRPFSVYMQLRNAVFLYKSDMCLSYSICLQLTTAIHVHAIFYVTLIYM
jgi:hypothetical protein